MNTINESQPADNLENLEGKDSIIKIKELVKASSGTCFLNTKAAIPPSLGVRPMTIQQVDREGNLWIFSARDSHTNAEINRNPDVQLFFQGSNYADFMYLNGSAEIYADKQRIDDLWQPMMKTWFTEGKEDPRITLIKVIPEEGYYWDNKHGNVVAGIKMIIGAVIGKTLDDSIEGEVKI